MGCSSVPRFSMRGIKSSSRKTPPLLEFFSKVSQAESSIFGILHIFYSCIQAHRQGRWSDIPCNNSYTERSFVCCSTLAAFAVAPHHRLKNPFGPNDLRKSKFDCGNYVQSAVAPPGRPE